MALIRNSDSWWLTAGDFVRPYPFAFICHKFQSLSIFNLKCFCYKLLKIHYRFTNTDFLSSHRWPVTSWLFLGQWWPLLRVFHSVLDLLPYHRPGKHCLGLIIWHLFLKSHHLCTDQHSTLKAKTLTEAMCTKEWLQEGLMRWDWVLFWYRHHVSQFWI